MMHDELYAVYVDLLSPLRRYYKHTNTIWYDEFDSKRMLSWHSTSGVLLLKHWIGPRE